MEALTDESGNPVATYGYTAYGKLDEESTTGKDDPRDPNYNPDDPYNVYRFNNKRWDPHTGKVDMGFRDYDPGLNRFLTRDMYNGALADMRLALDPWNMNRYAFAGGNPLSFVELDGHRYIVADGVYAHSITGKIVEDRSSSTASGSGSQNSALDAGSTERQIASAVTGFIPYAGEVQDATILFFGYDPVSGEDVSRWYGLALFLPFVGGGTVRGAVRGGSELIDEIGEGFEVLSRRWSGGGSGGARLTQYSGQLIKVSKEDPAADALAKRIGGTSRVKFSNDPKGREFDVISDRYIAQTKPALGKNMSPKLRRQFKQTFQAAKDTGRIPYFHFEGTPHPDVIRKLNILSTV